MNANHATLVRELIDNNGGARAIFSTLNNSGEGFDPTAEIGGWTLHSAARNTSDIAVYVDGADVVLVGTDGTGSDDSRWAVRVAGGEE